MANATDRAALFEQALSDAGCGDALMSRCCECYEQGEYKELEQLLKTQRAALLEKVHEGQKQIDCLDYLTYSLKKKH